MVVHFTPFTSSSHWHSMPVAKEVGVENTATPPSILAPGQDIYFSSQSLRAKLDDFLEDEEASSLILFFKQEPASRWGKWFGRKGTQHLALIFEKPCESGLNTTDSETVLPAVSLQWLEYTPLQNYALLLKLIQLPLLTLHHPTDHLLIERVAQVGNGDGPLLTEEQAGHMGVRLYEHPWMGHALQFLRGIVPQTIQRIAKPLLNINEEGTVTFLNRWTWNPTVEWKDGEGHSIQWLAVGRLANGVIVQVQDHHLIESGPLRQALWKTAMASIEKAEELGFEVLVDSTFLGKRLPANGFKNEPDFVLN